MMDQRREISLFFAIRPTIRNNLNAAFYRRDTDWKKRRKKVVASKPLWCRDSRFPHPPSFCTRGLPCTSGEQSRLRATQPLFSVSLHLCQLSARIRGHVTWRGGSHQVMVLETSRGFATNVGQPWARGACAPLAHELEKPPREKPDIPP